VDQRNRERPAGTVQRSFNRIEVVVSARGDVERVRLVEGPTRMPDMMLMSAVKSWKFAPAMKDDGPVRYRTAATWTGFP
jgi:TonB family protein